MLRPKPSDARIVLLPSTPSKPARDPRIDAFRGVALVMILINHMPVNPYEYFTTRNFGFSDAAEAFFIMSGIAAGIAYAPAMIRWLDNAGRLRDAVLPLWSRAWTLYTVQILLTVLAFALMAGATLLFRDPEYAKMHNLIAFQKSPMQALLVLPAMGLQLGYVNILPVYIVLMLAAPLMLYGALRAPRVTLAVSFILWWVGGAYHVNIPHLVGTGSWFLSPLSWQLIFVIGLLVGIRHRRGERLVPVNRALFWTAVAFLIFACAMRYHQPLADYINHKMAQLEHLGAPYQITTHDKAFLTFPRITHMLALAYVLSCPAIIRDLAGHRFAAPLRLMGQHSLVVFAFGTMFALAGQLVFLQWPGQEWLPWTVPPVAVVLSWLIARVKSWSKTAKPAAPPALSVPAAPVQEQHILRKGA